MDQFANLGPVAALMKLWNELTGAQRVVVMAFAILGSALLVVGVSNLTRPRMSVMFSNLSQEDAGAIVQKLSEAKVPYELSSDGSTVQVPESKVDELRLQMATAGLPQGTAGFESFDKSSFGMTEFMEQVKFKTATEGELTRTICSLSPVMGAKVMVSMPKDSIYTSDQEPAKASVALKLRHGQPLSDEQVGGIVRLVSSAVQGLKPENVTVVDTDGNVLSEGPAMSGAGGLMTSNQTKMKRQFEGELAQNLQSMLAKTVGPDKAVVRVSADLSFDQSQTKVDSFKPAVPAGTATGPNGQTIAKEATGVLISGEKKTETYNGAVVPPSGIPTPVGIGANGKPRVTGGSNDMYAREESTVQYGVDHTFSETVKAPGTVRRLSVAVLVDDKVDPATIGSIKEAVRAAAGVDEKTRGDLLTVSRMPFTKDDQKQMAEQMAGESRNQMIVSVAKNAGAVILLIVFFVFLKHTIKQIQVRIPAPVAMSQPATATAMPSPATVVAEMNSYQQATAPPPAEQFSTAKQEPTVPADVAKSSPEDLARLVKTWMSESH